MRRYGHRLPVLFTAFAIGGAASVSAQERPTRTAPARPPVPAAVPVFSMPEPHVMRLSNGLRVLLVADPRAPLFEARLVVESGWRDEPANVSGVSPLTRDLILRGAEDRAAGDMTHLLQSLGVHYAAGAGPLDTEGFTTTFALGGPTPSFEAALSLLAESVQHPAFREADLDAVKTRFSRRAKAAPAEALASNAVLRLVHASAARTHVAPVNSLVARVDVAAVRRFHSEHYRPERAVLVLVGPFQPDSVQALADRLFGTWQPGIRPEPGQYLPPPQGERPRTEIERPGSAQVTLAMGLGSAGPASADYPTMALILRVLVRRLDHSLREMHGWTYGMRAMPWPSRSRNTLLISVNVAPEHAAEALQEMYAEIRRLRDEQIPAGELEPVRRLYLAQFVRTSELRSVLADRLIIPAVLDLSPGYWSRVQAVAATATAESLRDAAQRYLSPGRIALAVVGDSTQLRALSSVARTP